MMETHCESTRSGSNRIKGNHGKHQSSIVLIAPKVANARHSCRWSPQTEENQKLWNQAEHGQASNLQEMKKNG